MRFLVFLTGFLMAAADSIPGVSGGTIAFIIGLYEELIESIKNLTKKDKRLKAIKFIFQLGTGWIIGLIISVSILSEVMEDNIYFLASLFIGLVFASIPSTIKENSDIMKKNYFNVIFSILGFIVVVGIMLIGSSLVSLNINSLVGYDYLYIMFVGFLAIGCMLLPGISGSSLFLIFGVYELIIISLHEFFNFNFEHILVLFSLGIGVLIGAYFSVKIISFLFKKYTGQIMYFIIGLMVGSILAVINGPTSNGMEALNISNFSLIGGLVGVLLIYLLNFYKTKKEMS
jgi:putative membrane protein